MQQEMASYPELLSAEACAQNDESGVRIYAMGADSAVEGA
jgi:hypothetical protein